MITATAPVQSLRALLRMGEEQYWFEYAMDEALLAELSLKQYHRLARRNPAAAELMLCLYGRAESQANEYWRDANRHASLFNTPERASAPHFPKELS